MVDAIGNALSHAIRHLSCMAAIPLLLLALNASAAPTLTIECSSAQIRKGESFKMYLKIIAEENMSNIDVKWIPPTGFDLKLDNENYPTGMTIGSSYTFAFSGTPPSSLNIGHRPGQDTRERKVFIFNVDYSTRRDGVTEARQQTVELNTGFSVNASIYLLWGVFGLLLGAAIKHLTRYGPDSANNQVTQQKTAGRSLSSSVIDLMSVTAIGFVVLLALARESIPTKGWYDSLALGVAVAILSDDQLLTRVKSLVPRVS
jgi:hypothetical protein